MKNSQELHKGKATKLRELRIYKKSLKACTGHTSFKETSFTNEQDTDAEQTFDENTKKDKRLTSHEIEVILPSNKALFESKAKLSKVTKSRDLLIRKSSIKQSTNFKLMPAITVNETKKTCEKSLKSMSVNVKQTRRFKIRKLRNLQLNKEPIKIPKTGLSFMEKLREEKEVSHFKYIQNANDPENGTPSTSIPETHSLSKYKTRKVSSADASIKHQLMIDALSCTETVHAKADDVDNEIFTASESSKTYSTMVRTYDIVDEVYSKFRDREKSTQTEEISDENFIEQRSKLNYKTALASDDSAHKKMRIAHAQASNTCNILTHFKSKPAHDTKSLSSFELRNQDFQINNDNFDFENNISSTVKQKSIHSEDKMLKTKSKFKQTRTTSNVINENIETEVCENVQNIVDKASKSVYKEVPSGLKTTEAILLRKQMFGLDVIDEVDNQNNLDWKYDTNDTTSQDYNKSTDKESTNSDNDSGQQPKGVLSTLWKFIKKTFYDYVAADEDVSRMKDHDIDNTMILKVMDSPNRIAMSMVEERYKEKSAAQIQRDRDWPYNTVYTTTQDFDKNTDKESTDSDNETVERAGGALPSILKFVKNTYYDYLAADEDVSPTREGDSMVVKAIDSSFQMKMSFVEERGEEKPPAAGVWETLRGFLNLSATAQSEHSHETSVSSSSGEESPQEGFRFKTLTYNIAPAKMINERDRRVKRLRKVEDDNRPRASDRKKKKEKPEETFEIVKPRSTKDPNHLLLDGLTKKRDAQTECWCDDGAGDQISASKLEGKHLTGWMRDYGRVDYVLVFPSGRDSPEVEAIKIHYLTGLVKAGLQMESEAGQDYREPLKMSTYDRSYVVHMLLLYKSFGEADNHYGLERLMKNNIVKDAFALHDGPHQISTADVNARQILYTNWATWPNALWFQPLHIVFEYFGPKVGFYFALYGLYNSFLLLASLWGVFMMGVYQLKDADYFKVIRNYTCKHFDLLNDSIPGPSEDHLYYYLWHSTVCAECEGHKEIHLCPYTLVQQYCLDLKIMQYFDSPYIVVYSIGIMTLVLLLVVYWRRIESFWAWVMEENSQNPISRMLVRPTYKNHGFLSLSTLLCPIRVLIFGILVPVFSIALPLVLIFVVYIVAYPTTRELSITNKSPIMHNLEIIVPTIDKSMEYAVLVVTALYLHIFLYIVEMLFHIISVFVTNCENHKTYESLEQNYVLNFFWFTYHNTLYVTLYFAWVKGAFYYNPIAYWDVAFNITTPWSENTYNLTEMFPYAKIVLRRAVTLNCGPFSCFRQAVVVYSAVVLFRVIVLGILGWIIRALKIFITGLIHRKKKTTVEREYALDTISPARLMYYYNYLISQFALVVLLAPLMPLAPLYALLINVWDIRVQAHNFLVHSRRTIFHRADGIGSWNEILKLICYSVPLFHGITIARTEIFQRYIFHKIYSRRWVPVSIEEPDFGFSQHAYYRNWFDFWPRAMFIKFIYYSNQLQTYILANHAGFKQVNSERVYDSILDNKIATFAVDDKQSGRAMRCKLYGFFTELNDRDSAKIGKPRYNLPWPFAPNMLEDKYSVFVPMPHHYEWQLYKVLYVLMSMCIFGVVCVCVARYVPRYGGAVARTVCRERQLLRLRQPHSRRARLRPH